MAAVLPPLIAAGGFGLYFLTSFRLARYRRVPWEFLAVVAAGAALGVYRLVAAPGAGPAIGAGVALGLPPLAGRVFFFLSVFRPPRGPAPVGARLPPLPPAVSRRPPLPPPPTDGRALFFSPPFLLDAEGVIRWVSRPDTYRVRAPARDILRAIDALP